MEAAPTGRRRRTWWDQMVATVRRNVTIKLRQKRRTTVEVFMPIYIFAILAIVRAVQPETSYQAVVSEHGSAVVTGPLSAAPTLQLHVTPDGTAQREFGRRLAARLNTSVEYHATEAELEQLSAALPAQQVVAGLVLPPEPGTRDLEYTIRTDPRLMLSVARWASVGQCRGQGAEEGLENPATCPTNDYFYSGFLQLQSHIDALMMEDQSKQMVPVTNLTMLNGPKHEESTDSSEFLRIFVPLYMAISLSQFITYLLTLIVGEKEAKIKDGLKLMGLRDSVYWFSWFVVYAVYVFVVASICIAIMVLSNVFPYSNNAYIYLVYVLYGWSLVMFGFMLTPFFTKAKVAGGVGNLAVTVVSLLFLLQVYLEGMPHGVYWLMSLISPVAFTLGIDRAVDFDNRKIGLHSFNMWDDSGGLPFGGCIVMLCVDIVLYAFLAFYLDNVLPNEYGRRESVFFIFKKSYWFGSNKSLLLADMDGDHAALDGQDSSPDVEPVSGEVKQKLALRVFGLRKEFTNNKKKVVAVNDLSLDMYEGQITAILGHNGAGKTTFFNMLTGLTTPTSGTASIYGLDITDPGDLRDLWGMIGLCPQHDILLDDLTPREHLGFIATLRGIPPERVQAEINSTLADVDLLEKADEVVRGLSGGQKRKLSVGQALVGDPRIIILDEPTAGVDPYSRRHLWSLLQRRKHGRLMLLTTHFMDEADILADRKAIVSAGKLRCCGSSMFLKNRFGLGYHLTIVQGSTPCLEAVDKIIVSYIPTRERGRAHGNELTFVLPMASVGRFPELFAELEKQQETLGVQSFGVSLTTLEEVFLHLAETEDHSADSEPLSAVTRTVLNQRASLGSAEHSRSSQQAVGRPPSLPSPGGGGDGPDSIPLSDVPRAAHTAEPPAVPLQPSWQRAMAALIRIRILSFIRVPAAIFFILIMPAAMMIGGLMINRGSSGSSGGPAQVPLHPTLYPGYSLLYHTESGAALDPAVLRGWGLPADSFNGSYRALLNNSVLAGLNVTSAGEAAVVLHDQAIHSPAVVLNAINNGRLSQLLQSAFNSSAALSVTSHPLPSGVTLDFDSSVFFSSFMVGFLFLMVPCSIAGELVQERELKIRNQLRVNGLSFTTYFLSFFIVVFGLFFALWVIMLIVVQAADVTLLKPMPAFSMLAVLYLEYIFVGLLFASIVSYMFDKLETSMSVYPNVAIMCGMLPYMLVSLLDSLLPDSGVALPLHYVFCLIDPFYIPCGALYYLSKTYIMVRLLEQRDVEAADYWAAPEFLVPLLVQLVQIPLLWLVLRRVDAKKNAHNDQPGCLARRKHTRDAAEMEEGPAADGGEPDQDVLAERERVDRIMDGSWTGPAPVIAAQNLCKLYRSHDKSEKSAGGDGVLQAVGDVSFAVNAGEVFGLLGPNGAGKTTCMRMVIAEEAPTRGKIQVAGTPITDSLSEAFQMVGYCPQFDALWKYITVEEHLKCFAQIRGVSPQDSQRIANHYIEGLQIAEHSKKRSHVCSGGTRRKLSYALSMLGEPRIVLLDEPSTGMDPQSKRFLWDTIAAGFRAERGAILTTHSMEEADALCTRLGIMVRGNLRCLGSTQHLKNKYGGGYMLEMKLGAGDDLSDRIAEARRLVSEVFPAAILEESYGERLRYKIPQQDVGSLSKGFSEMEAGQFSPGNCFRRPSAVENADRRRIVAAEAEEMAGDSASGGRVL
ncbi:phospholipid-transporting ATPase ABCA3-like, partial [Amphibalanus amphitrite]|uniref:phospholipid-transporting ATPase ABCA3-like n=1 Tax=Amphibalanus amphitrite TaxID=1232801 RepID=UPI001C915952